MAVVARVDDEGIVREVQVINDSDLPNNGAFSPEVDAAANAFQHSLGIKGNWKLTSYDDSFRRRYAGIGYFYDETLDEFFGPDERDVTIEDLEAIADASGQNNL
jgi:hypothetical protein